VVDLGLAIDSMECRAFDTQTKIDYKVFFGKSDRLGLQALTIFNTDGSTFHEYAYSGVKDIKPKLISFVKALNLRLELTEADVISSKTVIYYL
jgi:hypothetical protein